MNIENKQLLNEFILNNIKNQKDFDITLNKLNDFLIDILNSINLDYDNRLFFNLKLLGDYYLQSNFDKENVISIMIDYFASESDLNYSFKREKKTFAGKLLTDTFNYENQIIPTNNELLDLLYNRLFLKIPNVKIFKRKNCIYLKFLGLKFLLFFNLKLNNEDFYEFTIKSQNYNFKLDLMHENLIKKNVETKGNFFNLIKLFKMMEKELVLINNLKIKATKSLYFYENLLYNIPNKLIEGEFIYDNFINALTYLKNNKIEDFIDACENQLVNDYYKLFAKYYITTYDIKQVIKQSNIFIEHMNNIVLNNTTNENKEKAENKNETKNKTKQNDELVLKKKKSAKNTNKK